MRTIQKIGSVLKTRHIEVLAEWKLLTIDDEIIGSVLRPLRKHIAMHRDCARMFPCQSTAKHFSNYENDKKNMCKTKESERYLSNKQ